MFTLLRYFLGPKIFPCCSTRNYDFRCTMVVSGFDPYHRLWQGGTPTERVGAIPTPLAMPLALGFRTILLGDEWHVPPPPPPKGVDYPALQWKCIISFCGWPSYVISVCLRQYLDFAPYIVERVPGYLGWRGNTFFLRLVFFSWRVDFYTNSYIVAKFVSGRSVVS